MHMLFLNKVQVNICPFAVKIFLNRFPEPIPDFPDPIRLFLCKFCGKFQWKEMKLSRCSLIYPFLEQLLFGRYIFKFSVVVFNLHFSPQNASDKWFPHILKFH